MGGIYPVDRYKADGLSTAKVTSVFFVRRREVEIGNHPRRHLPVDRDLVESLKRGFDAREPLTVRDCGIVRRHRIFRVTNGCRRLMAAEVAERELADEGKLKKTGGNYMVAVVVVDGDDRQHLRERITQNARPLALPDSPSVLFAMFDELHRFGDDVAEMQKIAPRGCDVAAILRWPAIERSVQARLDAGDAPMTVIAALLDVPRDDQVAALDAMIAGGATTARKARRVAQARTGSEPTPTVRLPTPRAFEAMRGAVNGQKAPVSDVLALLAGDSAPLLESAPKLAEALIAAREQASKPGRKAQA